MYKLVALDMDGTLLNKNHTINDRVKKAIAEARNKGVKIILCSGRGFKGVEKYVKELGLNELVVSLNGAIVTDALNEEIVFSTIMDVELTKKIIELQRQAGIFTIYFMEKKMYIEEFTDKAKFFSDFEGVELTLVDNIDKYVEKSVGKMLMIGDTLRLEEFRKKLLKEFFNRVNATFSLPNFLEVYNINVSKGIILHKIAEYYGLEREEVIAIGDGENDISMIEYAGLGVAMGNAMEKAKEAADIVTLTNVEDGVAKIIEDYILKV